MFQDADGLEVVAEDCALRLPGGFCTDREEEGCNASGPLTVAGTVQETFPMGCAGDEFSLYLGRGEYNVTLTMPCGDGARCDPEPGECVGPKGPAAATPARCEGDVLILPVMISNPWTSERRVDCKDMGFDRCANGRCAW